MKNENTAMYTSFAMVYDELMDNIPYEEWKEYLVHLLQKEGIQKGQVVVELGCGTGKMTRLLAKEGYQMLGIDISEEMLMIARDKQMAAFYESGKEKNFENESVTDDDHILYIHQNMTELTLNGEVDAMVSICDSMNYLTQEEELYQTFCQAEKYLREGGVFIFDMKTPYFYSEVLADNTFAEDRDEVSFIWENYFDEETQINEYALSLFVPLDEETDTYRKFQEFHYQRAYTMETVQNLIEKAGLHVKAVYHAFSEENASETSERWYFCVRKDEKYV